jgi:hypothetical protein
LVTRYYEGALHRNNTPNSIALNSAAVPRQSLIRRALVSYLRRLLWYIVKSLLVLTMVLGMLIIAFYTAMNSANIMVLLKDGMAVRAQVIMMGAEPQPLTKYFQNEFLAVDTKLRVGLTNESPYADYSITGIDHRVSLEWMWCWPWDDIAHADFVESVPKIDGRIKAALRVEAEKNDPDRVYPPAWDTVKYRATLKRDTQSGRWKIQSITVLEARR